VLRPLPSRWLKILRRPDADAAPGARFLAGEPGMPGRIVKNAPFTGDLTTETTQILGDGNRIHETATAHMVRDSEGRTRREQSLSGLGPLGSPSGDAQAMPAHSLFDNEHFDGIHPEEVHAGA
jgi:hypothetical protein